MHLPRSARLLVPAAVMAAVVAACGGKSSSGPSKALVTRTTAADVVSVLKSHNVEVKGAISCVGIAPGIIDCHGTTTDNKDIQATLNASTAGQSCTGPMVINIDRSQLASLPDEKCS